MGLIATFTFGKSTCLICDSTLHNQVCGIHNVLHTSLLMEVTKLRRRISLCWSLFTNADQFKKAIIMLMENAFQQKHFLICSPLGDRTIGQVKLIRNRNQKLPATDSRNSFTDS